MCIFSWWQEQAYIKGAKWYRGDCSWAVDTYKVVVDTVTRGTAEATVMQIQCILYLPDKNIWCAQSKTDYNVVCFRPPIV